MEENKVRIFPRRLARSMAKARTGNNKLSRYDWRAAAADQAKRTFKKGASSK